MHPKILPLPALTSLRFFAALMVVLTHMDTQRYPVLKGLHLLNLDQAVSFFFILSGFILSYVYASLTPSGVPQFLAARIARLWPAHIFTALLAVIIVPRRLTNATHAAPALLVLISQLLMTHSWVPLQKWYSSLNSVSWSISTEFFFYLVFPLLQGLNTFKLKRLTLGLIALIGLIALAGQWLGLPAENRENLNLIGLLYIWPVCRVLEFVAGMGTARLFLRRRPAENSSPDARPGWKNTVPEIVVLLVTGCAMLLSNAPPVKAALFQLSPAFSIVLEMYGLTLLPFCALIYSMASGRGWISRLLSLTPFIFLGEISYALYLVHRPLLWIEVQLPLPLMLLLLLVASTLVYYGIEKPGRKLLLALFKRFTRQAVPHTVPDPNPVALTPRAIN